MPRHFIDETDDQLLYERCESFGGGMDAYRRSTLLPADAWPYGENVLVPDNLEVRTRPGANKLGTTRGGKIQGLHYFDTLTTEQLLAAALAKVFAWDGANWTDTAIALTDATAMVAMAQGVDKTLLSDGTAQMQLWDGANWSGGLGQTIGDPPVGATILVWHTGRMFAMGFGGGIAGKEQDAIWVSARLAFGTGNWDGIRRQFRVGGGEGDPIMAAASMQGFTLAVLKENSIWLVQTDPAADAQNFTASQASESLSYGVGCVGRRAWCAYGNDLLFMARDGVRSVQRMLAASGQYQLSAPLSEPMQPYIDRINWAHADTICAKKYKELALFSVPLDNSTSPNTVLVYNGRLGKWVGVWTGWTPAAWEITRFNGVQRLVHGDNTGLVRQWKDFNDAGDDATYQDDGAGFASKLWTRSMLFGEPINDKSFYHAEVRFSVSNALVNVTATADNTDLKTWQIDARQAGVDLPVDLPFDLAAPQTFAGRKGLRGLSRFNEIYLKIESTSGWWALRNVTLSAFLNMLRNQ